MKRFLIVIVCILFLLGILIALAPSFASTNWGRQQITGFINRSIPGKVEIHNLDLRWGHGQTLEGVQLYDDKGQNVLSFDRFSTEATLWQLINKSTHLGHTKLQGLKGTIITDEHGISNLQKALGLTQESYYRLIPPSTISLSHVNAEANLFNQEEPLSFHASGQTRQANLDGSFEIDTALRGISADDWEQVGRHAQELLSVEGSKEAKMNAKVINFPVDLIDRVIALKKPELNGFARTLLGDKINVILDKEPSSEGLAFNLSILAPLLQGEVKGKIVKGQFSLQEPATFQVDLNPEMINPLVQNQFQLLDKTGLKIIFNELNLPLSFLQDETAVDLCTLGLKANAQIDPARINIVPLGEMKVLGLNMVLDSPSCAKIIQINVKGRAQQGKEPFNINFDTTLTKPRKLSEFIQQIQQGSESNLTVSHLPTQLLGIFLGDKQPLLNDLLGSSIDFKANLKQSKNDEFDVAVDVLSPHLKINGALFKVSQNLVLSQPLIIQYMINPTLFKALVEDENLILSGPTPVQLTIQNFFMPLNNPKKGKFLANIRANQIGIQNLESFGKIQLNNFNTTIEGKTFTELVSNLTSQVALMKEDNSPSPYLKTPADFNLLSRVQLSPDYKLELSQFKMMLKSLQSSIQMEGQLDKEMQLAFTTPIEMTYQLTPEAFQEWTNSNQIALKNSPSIYVQTEPFQLNIKGQSLQNLDFKGYISADDMTFQEVSGKPINLSQINIPWEANALNNLINLNAKAVALADNKSSQLSLNVVLKNWLENGTFNSDHVQVQIKAFLMGVPTSLINAAIAKEDITPLLGPTIDIEFKTSFDRDQKNPGYWDMDINSAFLHLQGVLKIGEAITLAEDLEDQEETIVRWTLTPQGYQYLKRFLSETPSQGESPLLEPMTLTGKLVQIYLPLNRPNAPFEGGKIDLQLTTNEVKWKDAPQSKNAFPLALTGRVSSNNLSNQIDFDLNGRSGNQSLLTMKGSLSHFFDQQGPKTLAAAGLNLQLQAHDLPISFIRSLLFLDPSYQKQMQALIGDTVNIQSSIVLNRMNGTVNGQIEGERGFTFLNGRVNNGLLTLTQPLESRIKITPLLSETILSEHLPIFNTAIASEEPIRLVIDPNGFSLPISPFNPKELTIGKGVFYLGKVRFRNEGELKTILNLVKPIPADQLMIWFTPLYFQMSKGVLTAKRFDMLVAHAYTLAGWGDMDLNQDRAQMVIGVSAQALKYAFGIQGLSSNYMFQVPIMRRNGRMEVDKQKVAARISSLMAQTHLSGSKGKILGTLLDMAASDGKDPRPPNPTTQPFPWKDEMPSEEEAEPVQPNQPNSSTQQTQSRYDSSNSDDDEPDDKAAKKKHKKKKLKDQVFEKLEKGASSLFDQFKS